MIAVMFYLQKKPADKVIAVVFHLQEKPFMLKLLYSKVTVIFVSFFSFP